MSVDDTRVTVEGAKMISCPECDGAVEPGADAHVHEIVECPECRSELEVISIQPLLLALAPEIEEDWGE